MNCPECGSEETRILLTKNQNEFVSRRRRCADCGSRFNTYEVEEVFLDERFLKEQRAI